MPRSFLALVAAAACLILLLPVFAIVAALVAVVCGVRWIARLSEPSFQPAMELLAFDSVLGWKPRPNLDTRYLAENDDVWRLVTDQDGWPGRRRIEESAVVVIGDSFAFGYGVDTAKAFSALDPRLGVKAVGAMGYNMVQGVLLLDQLKHLLKGKTVVWFIYLENDLIDNLTPHMRWYTQPFVRQNSRAGGWEIVTEHVRPERWQCSGEPQYIPTFARLCTPSPISDRAYSACDYLIRHAAGTCSMSGARLAILTIPHPLLLTASGRARLAALSGSPGSFDENLPDARLAESCERYRIPMVAAKDHLVRADYKKWEGIHWNERGHRRIAKLLRRLHDALHDDLSGEHVGGDRPSSGGLWRSAPQPTVTIAAAKGASDAAGVVPLVH